MTLICWEIRGGRAVIFDDGLRGGGDQQHHAPEVALVGILIILHHMEELPENQRTEEQEDVIDCPQKTPNNELFTKTSK